MAKSFLVPINMNGLEIQNFLAHNLATAPTGSNGKIYFNTGDKKLYYYNGTSWVALTANTNIPKTTTTPKMDGTAAIGSETKYAAGDHVHPTDTSRVPTTRTVNGKALSSNITLDSTDIDAVISGNTSLYDDVDFLNTSLQGISQSVSTLGTAAYKNYDTVVTANSSNLITSGAVSTAIGSVDAMRFKGTIGTGGTVTSLPNAHQRGDTYRVITAGTYAGQTCEIGDLIIALGTSGTSASDWTVAQTNIDGAITSISGTSPISVTGSGSSRTVAIGAASGSAAGSMSAAHYTKLEGIEAGAQVNRTYTAVTGTQPNENKSPGFGGSFNVSQISQATSGQITAVSRTIKIPNATATGSAAGLMSSTHYTKLEGIAAGAQVNQNAFSNVKVGSTTVAADSATDTVELVAGNGITLAADATNDKVTITNSLAALDFTCSGSDTLTAGQTSKTISLTAVNIPVSLTAYDNSGNEVIVDVKKTESSTGNTFVASIASAVSYDITLRYTYCPVA